MNYYRVKIGYKPDEFISIDQSELEKALKAQIGGGVVLFKEGSVAGNSIISITPDYNRLGGYNRDHTLTGEDYRRLPAMDVESHRTGLQGATDRVQRQLKGQPEEKEVDRLPGVGNMIEDITKSMTRD